MPYVRGQVACHPLPAGDGDTPGPVGCLGVLWVWGTPLLGAPPWGCRAGLCAGGGLSSVRVTPRDPGCCRGGDKGMAGLWVSSCWGNGANYRRQ